jgi:hypothetical protein
MDFTTVRAIPLRGVSFLYTSPQDPPAGLEDPSKLLWLDWPWCPGDARVDIHGYSAHDSAKFQRPNDGI